MNSFCKREHFLNLWTIFENTTIIWKMNIFLKTWTVFMTSRTILKYYAKCFWNKYIKTILNYTKRKITKTQTCDYLNSPWALISTLPLAHASQLIKLIRSLPLALSHFGCSVWHKKGVKYYHSKTKYRMSKWHQHRVYSNMLIYTAWWSSYCAFLFSTLSW